MKIKRPGWNGMKILEWRNVLCPEASVSSMYKAWNLFPA
jgi:hypothetical protein